MTDNPTGAMQQFGAGDASSESEGAAGLVLLYAAEFEQLPAAWSIPRSGATIGRAQDADVHLPVAAVSRLHAEICYERSGWTLRDRGSTNGVLVDGHKVAEARLEHGEEVRIGDSILKFVEAHAQDYGHYRIDGKLLGRPSRLAENLGQLCGGYQIDEVGRELERISATPLSVVLLGESGTGKEVVANEIHRLSGRRGKFCAINCAAIPDNLLESELFGYKRGAFSGADRDKPGLVQTAHRGTLLLDEIGDMPLLAQAKLLRVLQSKEVFPVGATAPEHVDVRVICATHRDLSSLQQERKFREDLFARLNEYQLRLPPLRDRKEDVYLLLRALLKRHGRADLRPDFQFMTGLLHHDWPYNVRELEAAAKRAIALADDAVLTVRHLPDQVREVMEGYGTPPLGPAAGKGEGPRAPSEDELKTLLRLHKGNVAAVGRDLDKARMQVHRWLKRYGIDLEDYR